MVAAANQAAEAAHCSKYDRGHFSITVRSAWPLVYLKEFREDMHSYGFALEIRPRDGAAAIFLYNHFLRFGV